MALYTGKGDGGTTKLFDTPKGTRVAKSSPIFECLGQLDELNTIVGWAKVAVQANSERIRLAHRKQRTAKSKIHGELKRTLGNERIAKILHEVQDHLFTIQAEAAGAQKSVPQSSVEDMGELINEIEKELPEIKSFLVAGGSELSARLDIARAVSRRTERRLVTLHESGERAISESSRAYANRLSSLLYALARLANHRSGVVEQPPRYLT